MPALSNVKELNVATPRTVGMTTDDKPLFMVTTAPALVLTERVIGGVETTVIPWLSLTTTVGATEIGDPAVTPEVGTWARKTIIAGTPSVSCTTVVADVAGARTPPPYPLIKVDATREKLPTSSIFTWENDATPATRVTESVPSKRTEADDVEMMLSLSVTDPTAVLHAALFTSTTVTIAPSEVFTFVKALGCTVNTSFAGTPVRLGTGDGVGTGVGANVKPGAAVAGSGVGAGGAGVGAGVGRGVGAIVFGGSVGTGVGTGVGKGVGRGVGAGVGTGVGRGVGAGVGGEETVIVITKVAPAPVGLDGKIVYFVATDITNGVPERMPVSSMKSPKGRLGVAAYADAVSQVNLNGFMGKPCTTATEEDARGVHTGIPMATSTVRRKGMPLPT